VKLNEQLMEIVKSIGKIHFVFNIKYIDDYTTIEEKNNIRL